MAKFLNDSDFILYKYIVAGIESAHNPDAKNPNSSATGLYQFTKATWIALGYDWKDVFDPDIQDRALRSFTNMNTVTLEEHGIPINFSTLYAAHFLGAGMAAKVLSIKNTATRLPDVVPAADVRANPNILSDTVESFENWLTRKTGDPVTLDRLAGAAHPVPNSGPIGELATPPLWVRLIAWIASLFK